MKSADPILSLAHKYMLYSSAGKRNIDKQKLNSLRTFDERVEWLTNEGFDVLGFGTGRLVVLVNQRKVIKLAMNEKGVAQNEAEFNVLSKNKSEWFPKVFDKAPDNSWMEVELVKTLESMDAVYKRLGTDKLTFECVMEVTDNINDKSVQTALEENLVFYENWINSRIQESEKLTEDRLAEYKKELAERTNLNQIRQALANPKLISLFQAIKDFDIPANEYRKDPSHFGVTGDGRLVITDAGLTSDVFNNHYYKSPFQLHNEKEKDHDDEYYSNMKPPFKYTHESDPTYVSKDPKNTLPPPDPQAPAPPKTTPKPVNKNDIMFLKP